MTSLYTINEQILESIDLETGEIIDEAAFNALQIERDEKIEQIALWYKNLVSQANALKEEAKSFTDRQKSAESKANSLKTLLDNTLKGQKFSTVKASISYRKSSSVNIEDDNSIPDTYKKETVTVSISKTDIAKDLKAGKDVPGASIKESNNIQIK